MTVYCFVGADPAGLAGLADIADQYAIRIGLVGHEVAHLVDRHCRRGESINSVLAVMERELGEQAESLRWRASAIEEAQHFSMPFFVGSEFNLAQLADFAANAVFDLSQWEEAYARWRTQPSSHQLLNMEPLEVADVFASLDPSIAESLARRSPRTIGGLDGAPPALRYLANDLLIRAEIVRLERQIAELRAEQLTVDRRGSSYDLDFGGFAVPAALNTVTAALTDRAEEYRRWLREERQILLFDPDGDGRAVEVFGDMATATRVAIVVPGMGNSIDNFSTSDGGFRDNAATLFDATRTGGVATIAWLGYDTPDNVGAAVRNAAEDGAPDLIGFLEWIDPGEEKVVTVVAHSYGSVLAGVAAGEGIAADNLVFVGSPGTSLDHASDAVLRRSGRVWSALADDDPIAWSIAPTELPPWPLLPDPIGYLMGFLRACTGAAKLWHGTNPVADEFGAIRIATDGSSGHSSYFESGALDNLALIVEGRYSDVVLGG